MAMASTWTDWRRTTIRHLIPRTCNSIEPGIYLPEFGIRSEVNVYVGEKEARVTGAVQKEILALLA